LVERSWWFRAVLVTVFFSAVIFVAGALGRVWGFLGDLLLIFFFAWLIGSLLIHVVNSLMRVPHMRRPLAILLVYLGLITLILDFAFLVIPNTVTQIEGLADEIPSLVETIPALAQTADNLLSNLGLEANLVAQVEEQPIQDLFQQAGDWLTTNAVPILQNIASALFSITLVIVISFYIVLDGGRRLREALKVLPPRAERETWFVLTTIDETFHGYVRGMIVVSAIYGVGTATVMATMGLPAAFPTAILSSILLMVPFIGDWLALILPLTIAALAGDFVTFLVVLAVLLFVQQVMLNLLTPRILGRAVRMPAMLVIVSVVLGARLAGVSGALLGVPTAGVLYTLAVHYGTGIRQRREARDAVERDERESIEREGFAEEVERALQVQEETPR